MRIFYFGLTLCTMTLCADGLRDADDACIAGKDFPFPPDESVLPESTYDDNGGDYYYQNRTRQPGNKTKTEKDIFPPPEEEKRYTPEVNSDRPSAGKDIFPPEED